MLLGSFDAFSLGFEWNPNFALLETFDFPFFWEGLDYKKSANGEVHFFMQRDLMGEINEVIDFFSLV